MFSHLMHRICKESFKGAPLTDWLLFVSPEQLVKLKLLFVLGQHLKAVVVVSHILLVDPKHRQQHVEQVTSKKAKDKTNNKAHLNTHFSSK